MADNSLDDFFAKKDKSKKKNKAKVNPNDLFSQSDSGNKKIKKKKDKNGGSQGKDDDVLKKEDEDWIEFDSGEDKDYSGLRIATIDSSSKDSPDGESGADFKDEIGGSDADTKDGPQGPWNREEATNTSAPPPPPQEEVVSPVEIEPEPSAAPKKYVPPALRNAAAANSAAPLAPMKIGRRSKAAPNIKSDEDFPSLGGAPIDNSYGTFEDVKPGGRKLEDPTKQDVRLELGNKFQALTSSD